MADSNRLQLASVKEVTLGVTPVTPRMRKARITSEGLTFQPQSVMSDELRDDRMNPDPIKVGENNQGPISFELSYPPQNSPLSTWLESVFFNTWVQTPERDNDGIADSIVTGVAATGGIITVTTGAPFVVGHLIKTTGFGIPANNGLFPITTGSATVPAVGSALLTDEAAPAAAARVKAVGLQGTAGDLTAVAGGLSSTTLNFTTFVLTPGQWVKVGGTGAAFRFANEVLNVYARVAGTPTATFLPLDNLPAGWTTDAGTGKTLRVFFGDTLRNGVAMISQTFERGFMDQAAPTYIAQNGMVADQMDLTIAAKQKIAGSITFTGMGGTQGTTSLDAVPDPAPDQAVYPIMAGSVNVGRIAENGATLTGPNWVRSIRLAVRNNLRMIEAVDSMTAVSIGAGTMEVTAQVEAYFGSNILLTKVMAMEPTNVSARLLKNNRALIFGLPRLVPMSGTPNAGGRNQDVMMSLAMQASRDTLTGVQLSLDRMEHVEA